MGSTNGTALQHPGHAPELLERDVSAALQDGSTLIIPAKTKSRKEAGPQRVHIVVKFAALAPSKAAQWQVANGVGSGDPITTMEESVALQQQPHLPGEDTFTPPSICGTEQRLAAARAMLAQAQADTSALSSSVQQVNSSPPLGTGLALSTEECGKPRLGFDHHGVQANALPVTGMTTKARAPLPCFFSPPPPPPPPRPKFFLPTPLPAAFPREKSSPMNSSMAKVAPPSYLVAEVLETMAPQKGLLPEQMDTITVTLALKALIIVDVDEGRDPEKANEIGAAGLVVETGSWVPQRLHSTATNRAKVTAPGL